MGICYLKHFSQRPNYPLQGKHIGACHLDPMWMRGSLGKSFALNVTM